MSDDHFTKVISTPLTNTVNIFEWSQVPREKIEEFGDEGDFARQNILTPLLLDLIGDIKDKKVMDAGCGNGYLSRKLAKMGAKVTGVDASKNLIAYAIEKEHEQKLGIIYIKRDLSILENTNPQFDIVVSNMVFMDIPDYVPAIENCIKSLKVGGKLVFSISHPCFEESSSEWDKNGYVKIFEYFNEYHTLQKYGYSIHRPLSKYVNLIIQNGCVLNALIEPQLDEKIAQQYPEYDKDLHVPSFLVLSATKEK
jgi:SAM-dependent methyltransferase